jgi:hypothetical protein
MAVVHARVWVKDDTIGNADYDAEVRARHAQDTDVNTGSSTFKMTGAHTLARGNTRREASDDYLLPFSHGNARARSRGIQNGKASVF